MKFHRYIFFFLLLTFAARGWAQNFPFNCLVVNSNGDVDLDWSLPSSNDVVKYRIYYAFNGNNFVLIDSIDNELVTQYHHVGAQANDGLRKYFIEAVVNSGPNIYTDTLNTIFLQMDNSDQQTAKLYWNAIHTPLPSGSSLWYKIYSKQSVGQWNLIDSTQNIRYFHRIHVCIDSLTFRIVIENTNCQSISNLKGGWFKDTNYPDKPILDSVSVDVAGNVILGWEASDSNDVAGYIIYRFEGSIFLELDTVFGKTNTFYTDTSVDACEVNQEYAIASIDSCDNKSPGTFSQPQRAVFLYPVKYNTCARNDTLHWEAYINASPNIEKYEILISENGGTFQKKGEVPANKFSYIHQGLDYGKVYSYIVRAVYGNKTASSCAKQITTSNYKRPDFIYLANANVLSNNSVDLKLHVDTAVKNCEWEIWRSEAGKSFGLIKTLTQSDLNGLPLQTNDATANASTGTYDYKIKVLDSCHIEALESNVLKTIWLNGTIVSAGHVRLKWTAFQGWDAGVIRYRIYRMEGTTPPSYPIDSVEATTLTFDDNFASLSVADGRFTYWIQAVENSGNSYGYHETANSNRLLLLQESQVFFPNAFRPDGINNTFKPIFLFFGGTFYVFQIYNRWGQIIFESHNPEESWNGTYKGKNVEQGLYIYRLAYKNAYGISIEKKGSVTVLY